MSPWIIWRNGIEEVYVVVLEGLGNESDIGGESKDHDTDFDLEFRL
jgi:hypothetical protein